MNEELMRGLVYRIESAQEAMRQSAGLVEANIQRLAVMFEPGYGGNGSRLVELMEQSAAPIPDAADTIASLTRERDEARLASAVAAEQRDTAEGKSERLEEELAAVRSEATVMQIVTGIDVAGVSPEDYDRINWGNTSNRVRRALGMPEVKP